MLFPFESQDPWPVYKGGELWNEEMFTFKSFINIPLRINSAS